MDQPGHNYPLFFHDEAVALAAGHRPCGECRPQALATFIEAWKIGHGMRPRDWVPLREIDKQLHQARLAEMRRRTRVDLNDTPDGAFVWCPAVDHRPLLKIRGQLIPWAHGGYGVAAVTLPALSQVFGLTPLPIINALKGVAITKPTFMVQTRHTQ